MNQQEQPELSALEMFAKQVAREKDIAKRRAKDLHEGFNVFGIEEIIECLPPAQFRQATHTENCYEWMMNSSIRVSVAYIGSSNEHNLSINVVGHSPLRGRVGFFTGEIVKGFYEMVDEYLSKEP